MKEVKVINLTPHEVRLVGEDGKVLIAFPPSGQVARLVEEEEKLPSLSVEGTFVPLRRKKFGRVENLPSPQEGTLYIVSLPVAQAMPERHDLLVPHKPVRDEKGRVVGARALASLSSTFSLKIILSEYVNILREYHEEKTDFYRNKFLRENEEKLQKIKEMLQREFNIEIRDISEMLNFKRVEKEINRVITEREKERVQEMLREKMKEFETKINFEKTEIETKRVKVKIETEKVKSEIVILRDYYFSERIGESVTGLWTGNAEDIETFNVNLNIGVEESKRVYYAEIKAKVAGKTEIIRTRAFLTREEAERELQRLKEKLKNGVYIRDIKTKEDILKYCKEREINCVDYVEQNDSFIVREIISDVEYLIIDKESLEYRYIEERKEYEEIKKFYSQKLKNDEVVFLRKVEFE